MFPLIRLARLARLKRLKRFNGGFSSTLPR